MCRLPTGPGVRLDFSDCLQGSVVTPFYDPTLVKCTARGPSLKEAALKSLRALREIRIEGVETNVSFLLRILTSHAFLTGGCWTTFIDESPHLMKANSSDDIDQKFLRFLAETAINGSMITGQMVCHNVCFLVLECLFAHSRNKRNRPVSSTASRLPRYFRRIPRLK